MSGTGGDAITPELALVDPVLAEAQRQAPERKVTMSSEPPANGTFFIDPAHPAPAPVQTQEPSPAPPPLVTAPAAAPAATPAPASPPPAEPVASAPASPTRDVPLGTLIFRAGLLAEEQLEDALQEGMRTGKRLGEVLLERGWLHERDLGRLLAAQKGLAFVELNGTEPDPAALQMLPEEKSRLQTALPLRFEDGQLVVAVADPSNDLMLENLRRALGYQPQLVVAAHGELARAIDDAYRNIVPAAVSAAPVADATPDPTPAPAVPTLQAEPAPAVTPMPTVLPPAEDRAADAPAPAPLFTPAVEAAPVAEEAPLQSPTPAAEPIPVAEPPPLQPPPPAEPMPVEEPPPLQPPAAPEQEVGPAELPEPAALPPEPQAAPEPMPIPPLHEAAPLTAPVPEAPVLPPEPQAVKPPAPAPVVEPVAVPEVEAVPPVAEPPEPVQETPAPITESPEGLPAPVATEAKTHFVVLRLREGEQLEIGAYATAEEARAQAQEVVSGIAAAEVNATWPFFAERFLRPETIVSVDVLEESGDKWMGSAVRTRWAHES